MSKKDSEIMWAITGWAGLYVGTWLHRKDAIREHCEALGRDWRCCRRHGDRVVKVRVTILEIKP